MNDRQKQIEEIAKLMLQGEIDREKGNIDCAEFDYITQFKAGLQRLAGAKSLYEAGYRKQSDTAREILKRITNYSLDYNYDLKLEVQKIAEDYGVEVE